MAKLAPFLLPLLRHAQPLDRSSPKFAYVIMCRYTIGSVLLLSPFISVLCHSDWLFHGESCSRLVVHPGRVWSSSHACTRYCFLHYLFLHTTLLFLMVWPYCYFHCFDSVWQLPRYCNSIYLCAKFYEDQRFTVFSPRMRYFAHSVRIFSLKSSPKFAGILPPYR